MTAKRPATGPEPTGAPPTKRCATHVTLPGGSGTDERVSIGPTPTKSSTSGEKPNCNDLISTLTMHVAGIEGVTGTLQRNLVASHAELSRSLDLNRGLKESVETVTRRLEAESSNYLTSMRTINELKAALAGHERIEREYGIKHKWESKLKILKAEQDMKLESYKKLAAMKQSTKDEEWRERLEKAREKSLLILDSKESAHRDALDKLKNKFAEQAKYKEDVWKAKFQELKTRSTETLTSKEAVWKGQVSELRAGHKEQLAKVRANVKMVEAAQRIVELDAGKAKRETVVKVE
ncbi:hypothetical protein LTR56_022643 [Elasticomyces elasticus]|nr:hypothetical protein LTR22_026077 [Elasticomyces elasticus]KAK3621676.1 hypothetical protein LTR56_022643 [Elasticomyces elasticus]KAK4921888.1 hypothetical protein LTR49_010661 [Elasticomyces elasticus]KAK5740057.1 hypothetical protein LTS12_025066 [Elasticomyces elasticus]